MKKGFWIGLLALAASLAVTVGFAACGGGSGGGNSGNGSEISSGESSEISSGESGGSGNGGEENPPVVPPTVLTEITGVTFNGATKTYDGQKTTLTVTGEIPAGVGVVYSNNEGTDAGEYQAKATLSGDGYETLVLKATLKIEKAAFPSGVTLSDATYSYDGKEKAIYVVGNPPDGAKISYSCQETGEASNKATASGTYTITATITHKNYHTKTLTAVMTIEGSEDERHIAAFDGKLYFANALDKDKLYSYDGASVTKISSDVPYNFTVLNGVLYYRSVSLFASSVKSVESGASNSVASEKGEYLCTDGTSLYYAVNNLLSAEKSGIYRLDLSGSEPAAVKLASGKAKYLQVYDGFVYFADGANGWKLTKISVTGGTKTLVRDEKITCLTQKDGYLFYTVDNLLGDYIESYRISNGKYVKLTQDAGANLTVIGNDLYYVNVDLVSSYLQGKGIYRVNAYPSSDSNQLGVKVVGEANEKYSSLTESNGKLAYYRVSDQMLCLYNFSTKQTTEVLKGFVAPESIPLSQGSKATAYGNLLYYLDLHNGKTLWSYNTKTGVFSRITSNKVADFSILGDWLYYNAVNFGVNNDLYRINLKTGGEPEKISTYDCNDIVTDGTSLFYVEQNAAGVRTAIHVIKQDGTDEIMYTKGAHCLTYYDGYLYFEDGSDLLKMPVIGYTKNQTTTVKEGNVDFFTIANGVVYYREVYNWGASKRLSKINVDGTGYAILVPKSTDPIEITVVGDTLYYYTDTISGNSGLYSVSVNGGTPTLILDRKSNEKATYYASELTVIDNQLYFINYYNNLGDSHLYKVDLKTKKLTKIA